MQSVRLVFAGVAWTVVSIALPVGAVCATNLPSAPQNGVDTTFVPPTGASLLVNAGDDLQKALELAAPGDEIVLAAGATFTGNFSLRNKISGAGWITIRTSDMAHLPGDGQRVNPSDATTMPKIITTNFNPALTTEPGAHNYRIVGVEFAVAPQVPLNYNLVFLGDGGSLDQLPANVIFDRVYLHGAALCHCKRGLVLNSISTAVINSYLSEFHGIGQDTQALLAYNGPGPFKIVNNYFEASGENVMFGGAPTLIPNLVPSDIEFRQNYLSKPLRWRSSIIPRPEAFSATAGAGGALASGTTYYYVVVATGPGANVSPLQSDPSAEQSITLGDGQSSVTLSWSPVLYGDSKDSHVASYTVYRTADPPFASTRSWNSYDVAASVGAAFNDTGEAGGSVQPPRAGHRWVVKNLFELKNGQRVLINGNVFENCWADAQNGTAILFTPRIQDNQLWTVVQDITATNNIIRHAGTGFLLLGMDDVCEPNQLSCQQSARLLIQNNLFDDISAANWSGHGWLMQVQHTQDATINHNTGFNDSAGLYVYQQNVNLTIINNIMHGNVIADGSSGQAALAKYAANAVVTNNVFAAADPRTWSGNANYLPKSLANISFINYTSGLFALGANSPYKSAGTDQLDVGADFSALGAATIASVVGRIPARAPAISSVLNDATLTAGVAPGSVVSLFGVDFSALPFAADTNPIPSRLGDTAVSFNGVPAPLLMLNSGQIRAQLPFEAPTGSVSAVVTVAGVSSAPFSFQVLPAAPGLYRNNYGSSYAMAVNQDYSENGPAHPAMAGTVLTAYLTGLGSVNPAVSTAALSPSSPLSQPVLPVTATVAGQPVQIVYVGLTPNTAGIFQTNFVVPSLPSGDYPLVVTVGDTASNSAEVSISSP